MLPPRNDYALGQNEKGRLRLVVFGIRGRLLLPDRFRHCLYFDHAGVTTRVGDARRLRAKAG